MKFSTKPPVESDPKTATATERLRALARIATSLGQAIRGAGQAGAQEQVKDLTMQLMFVAKRACWIEKAADPDWTPYGERAKP